MGQCAPWSKPLPTHMLVFLLKKSHRDKWAFGSHLLGHWSELGCLRPPEHPPRSRTVDDVETRPTAAELQPAPYWEKKVMIPMMVDGQPP